MTGDTARFRIIPMPVIVALLAIGLISSLAFRAIIIAEHVEPAWVRPLWYLGVLLNAIFFAYRYRVSLRRVRAVVDGDLDRKMRAGESLSEFDRAQIAAILYSIRISPERFNYLVIFILSALAIAADIGLSMQGP
ncbi:MAG: hypothetical protein V5A42_03645 [Halofilum sp. (in: g-proteobacteria)]